MSKSRVWSRLLLWGTLLGVCCALISRGTAQEAAAPKADGPAAAPGAIGVAPAEPRADAGVAAAEKDAKALQEKSRDSLWALIVKGGVVMIPLGMCSVAGLAIAVERFISLSRKRIIKPNFIEGLKTVITGNANKAEAVTTYCQENPCPMSEIFKEGVRRLKQGQDAVEKAIEDAGSREVFKLKRSLRPLSSIATISPLLGLLGTVYGMISAFQVATAAKEHRAEVLSKGIYEALVTTAAGLTIAIPVMLVHQILTNKVDNLVDEIDERVIDFLEYSVYES